MTISRVAAEVAAVAPAGAVPDAAFVGGELAQDVPAVVGLAHPGEQVAVADQLRRQVADELVEPVGGDPGALALGPPVELRHVLDPRGGDVPVVVDVVVVDHHRGRHGREQPADVRVLPGLAIEPRVLLEVGDFLPRRLADVAALADEGEGLGRDLVGVDLVAEQQQSLWPAVRIAAQHLDHERVEGVELAPVGVLVLRQRVRAVMGERDPAGAEGEAQRAVATERADRARRQFGAVLGPAPLAVERDLVLGPRTGVKPIDDHERVVVAGDVEGWLAMAEDLHLARLIGLDPEHGLGLPDVTQQWSEHELRHAATVPAWSRPRTAGVRRSAYEGAQG